MKRWLPTSLGLAVLVALGMWINLWAGQPPAAAPDAPTQRTLEALVKAFNAADAKGVGACFTAGAEMIDDEGNGVMGREAIEKLFADFFAKSPGAKLHIQPETPRQVAPTLVMEDGTSTVTLPDAKMETVRRYAMAFVKQGDGWLLASLREFPSSDDTHVFDALKELEWLVGDWIDESPAAVVMVSSRWTDDRRAIVRDFSIRIQGRDAMNGTQRITVDPLTGQIKGWAFDSAGGHGESTWVKNGDEWIIKTQGVSSDGEASSATHMLKPLGADRVQWKTVHRISGNRVESDLETILVRRPPAQ
ncbi:MAG TPA: SgcJ/EcaC family oxidoreductase [Gemmatales bacterium]|nr:SgcJ/EcaC family oxidoreductase [Gemmatales bacterium]